MSIGGYNDTMAAGIRMLVEGIIQAVASRHSRHTPLHEIVESTLRDIGAMNSRLLAQRDLPDSLRGLVAINLFVESVFPSSQDLGEEIEAFSSECRARCEQLIELARLTKERHELELEKAGQRNVATKAVTKTLLGEDRESSRYFDVTNPQWFRRYL